MEIIVKHFVSVFSDAIVVAISHCSFNERCMQWDEGYSRSLSFVDCHPNSIVVRVNTLGIAKEMIAWCCQETIGAQPFSWIIIFINWDG